MSLPCPSALDCHIVNLTKQESVSTQFWRETLSVECGTHIIKPISKPNLPGLEGSGIKRILVYPKAEESQQFQELEDSGALQDREEGANHLRTN